MNEFSNSSPADERERPPLDELFDALGKPPRRRILTALADVGPRDADEFAPEDLATGQPREQFLASLHHAHLPRLDEAGFVDWDPDAGTVRRGPRYEAIAPLVELLVDNREELPADWP